MNDQNDSVAWEFKLRSRENRRLRPALVEGAWRLLIFQPDYRAVKKWGSAMLHQKNGKPRRKKLIIALARTFAVDWWRVRTGRCKAEELGLKLQPFPLPKPLAP